MFEMLYVKMIFYILSIRNHKEILGSVAIPKGRVAVRYNTDICK